MNKPIKWAAEIAHVQEVSLLGTADLAFWKERLLKEKLHPAESDGQAQLQIIAANIKYMSIRFRELSFSVAVSRPKDGTWQNSAYLVRAFNSCRLFAFCERVLFSTPYYHGDVRLSVSLPASMQLAKQGEVVFAAEMGAAGSAWGREPSHSGDERWEGPVFLPQKGRQSKLFVARVMGSTRRYPFVGASDSMTIRPSPDLEVLQALKDSHFVIKEWIVREDATHAKSKTYVAADLLN